MFLCGLSVTPTSQLDTTDVVSGATAETKEITVKPIPKAEAAVRDKASREFQRQGPVTGASYVLTKLLFVRGEDADASPAARNRHIPLLGVRRGFDGGI